MRGWRIQGEQVTTARHIDEGPEGKERRHDCEECDQSEVAPNEWKNALTRGANQAEAIQARRIFQLPGNPFSRLQQQHKSEPADQPVPKPQGTCSKATRVADADDEKHRRDPEKLRQDDRRNDTGNATTEGEASKQMGHDQINHEHSSEIGHDGDEARGELFGHGLSAYYPDDR